MALQRNTSLKRTNIKRKPVQRDVEPGYCQCGCGEWIGFWARTTRKHGQYAGEPKQYVRGHNMRKERTHSPGYYEEKRCTQCDVSLCRQNKTFLCNPCWLMHREVPSGESHYAWKGDAARNESKRERAQKMFPLQPCEVCGSENTERHHKDDDPGNNVPENIAFLCRLHHMETDGRLERLVSLAKTSKPPAAPLCNAFSSGDHHGQYDTHRLDLLPFLTDAEFLHAVGVLGYERALKRVSGG